MVSPGYRVERSWPSGPQPLGMAHPSGKWPHLTDPEWMLRTVRLRTVELLTPDSISVQPKPC